MADIVDAATRSRMMSGIRAVDTRPELHVRQLLHRAGFRYRLHVRTMPGCPDIVLPKHRAVIFVHGCFWHGHSCPLFRLPSTRSGFWQTKINRNQVNDDRHRASLTASGWRVATIWECALRGRCALDDAELLRSVAAWLHGGEYLLEVAPGTMGET